MSLSRYRNDNPRTAQEIADAIEVELESVNESIPVVEGTQTYAYVTSFANTLAAQQEQDLNNVYDAGFVADATGKELTKKARELGVFRQDATAATGVVEFSSDSATSQDRTAPAGTRVSTGGNDPVVFETIEPTTISSGTTTAQADARCVDTGPVGNIGASTISVLVDKPAGIDSVTNPDPMGDPSFTLTDGTTKLVTGADKEDDESLRERALDTNAIGGAGTAPAVELALENVEEIISADVVTNRTSSTSNNIDPWHTEVRVYGGSIDTIANKLYDVLPLATIKTLQGGANGTLESTTIEPSDLYGQLTIEITRPTEVALEITIDLVHDATYSGTNAAKDAIVDYIGGTATDGSTEIGLEQGEDIIANRLENVVEDVDGVVAVTNSVIDDNTDGVDDTTTDVDGVRIYSVADSEIATVDASNITINETAR